MGISTVASSLAGLRRQVVLNDRILAYVVSGQNLSHFTSEARHRRGVLIGVHTHHPKLKTGPDRESSEVCGLGCLFASLLAEAALVLLGVVLGYYHLHGPVKTPDTARTEVMISESIRILAHEERHY